MLVGRQILCGFTLMTFVDSNVDSNDARGDGIVLYCGGCGRLMWNESYLVHRHHSSLQRTSAAVQLGHVQNTLC